MFLGLTQDLSNSQVKPLLQFSKHWSLSKKDDNITLLSNICPHQNSMIAKTKCGTLVCPYHGMTFGIDGNGVGNKHKLKQRTVFSNGNMLFDCAEQFPYPVDLSYMELVEERVDFINTSVEIFMDVFLDIDHIPVAHPDVYDKIDISNISKIKYDFFTNGSHQYVTADDNQHIIKDDKQYNLGALWTAVYPGTTIEWQPGALFVNEAIKTHNGVNVYVFKYRDSRYSEDMWTLNSDIWEEAWGQDKDLCEMIVSLPTNDLSKLKQHHRNAI